MPRYTVFMDEISTYAHTVEAKSIQEANEIALNNLNNGDIGDYIGSEWSGNTHVEEDDED